MGFAPQHCVWRWNWSMVTWAVRAGMELNLQPHPAGLACYGVLRPRLASVRPLTVPQYLSPGMLLHDLALLHNLALLQGHRSYIAPQQGMPADMPLLVPALASQPRSPADEHVDLLLDSLAVGGPLVGQQLHGAVRVHPEQQLGAGIIRIAGPQHEQRGGHP